MRRNAMISVLPIFLIFHAVESGSVLITTTSLFPVHRYTMRYLAEELLKRGHQVTWFEYGLIKPKISLPKSVREEFVVVSTRNKNINDLYLFRNHSAHSLVWLPTFDDPLQQTDAWLASLQLCDEAVVQRFYVYLVYNPFTPTLPFHEKKEERYHSLDRCFRSGRKNEVLNS
ncbi:hypothetical protein AB6A40_009909 [Gnathostoma spinigerum]|uniref:UDP-glucuronosyltransferase n=1 Tax=Gnathostoma spinigerum TaxID=75299 RepID=A0ABD6EUK6_9BILA